MWIFQEIDVCLGEGIGVVGGKGLKRVKVR